MTDGTDPHHELWSLTQALRAHLEWQEECGAVGLPAARAEDWAARGAPRGRVEGAPSRAPAEPATDGRASTEPERRERRGELEPPARVERAAAVSPPPRAALPAERRAPAGGSSGVQGDVQGGEHGTTRPAPRPAGPSAAGASAEPPAAPALRSLGTQPLEERLQRLTLLATEVSGCQKCGLHEGRTQTVFSRGSGSSRLCFVGEGPGADEDAQGEPFVGKAGQLLDRMIEAMGLARDEVYVCNIVKCRPPNNRAPTPAEMGACSPYLREQLELIAPEVIVALGGTAVQGLFGGSAGGITRQRGQWKVYGGRIAVMPTFHPAYLLRNPSAKREVWSDLQAVVKHLGRELPSKG